MTRQQRADRDLAIWQANRDLKPIERMAKLVGDFMTPPLMPINEFEWLLDRVAEQMAA